MKNISRKPLFLGMVVVCCGGTLYGCKDFLTDAAKPQGTLDAGTLANRAGVEGTLIAAYRSLDFTTGVGGAWGSAASNWIWGSVASDDAYKGSEATDQPNIDPVELYQWSASGVESELNDKWRASYEGIVRSNAAIRLLKDVTAATPGAINTADARSIEGEALFLRAHFHFEAWRMWGNIPYYRETDTDFRKTNQTATEVATEIVKDLDAAIALLPTTARAVGRASQWTAKAYKGRVLVYSGQFAPAITALREVRTAGPYALEASFDRVWTGFKEFENGKETILAYQASANDGQASGNNSNYGERLTFPHSGSPFGCCGFHQPSQELVNFFATDPVTGLPASITDANWNASNANLTASASATSSLDPRLDWTVGRNGVPFKDYAVTHNPEWIRSTAYGGPYSPKKSMHEKSSGAQSTVGWVSSQLNSVNIHIFRYADLLLLLAEAEIESGSLENARTIINEVRTRAGVRAQGRGTDRGSMAVPINDPTITWAAYRVGLYTTPFANQAAARTAVRAERRLELAMEGQRFFDLRRWGIAEATLNAHINVEKTRRPHLAAAAPFTARHLYFPIPAIQIELSKGGTGGGLKQNTGW